MDEKIKDQEVLLVKDSKDEDLKAVSGTDEKGGLKTVPPTAEHEQSFLKFDKRSNALEDIKNLSTPIVIDQKKMGSNLRSTVGTATELATYIRLLYSRIGQPFLNLPSWCIQKVLTTVSDAEDSAVRGLFRYCENNLPQAFREQTPHGSCDVIRDALVIGLGYSSCDAGEGIAVSAHGYRLADCILKVVRLKEGDDGLGDRTLSAGVPFVGPVQKLIAALKVIAIS